MAFESKILFAVPRASLPEPDSRTALSRALGVNPDDMADVNAASAGDVPVHFNIHTAGSGAFSQRYTAYVDPMVIRRPETDVEFARALARTMRSDVITTLPVTGDAIVDANPYLWILVRPDGAIYRVEQSVTDESEDGPIVLDECADLKPWP